MLDNVLELFPDSAEAVRLIGDAMAILARPVAEGDDDGRRSAVLELFAAATPEARTRACTLAGVMGELSTSVRAFALQVKSEQNDADIATGDAVVTPDGCLVVTMAGKEIGRVPYNPHRQSGATELAEDMLREYVRLHGRGDLEVANFAAQLPVIDRKRTVVALVQPVEQREPDTAIDIGPAATH